MTIFCIHYTFIFSLLLTAVFATESEDDYAYDKYKEYDNEEDTVVTNSSYNKNASISTDEIPETKSSAFVSNFTFTYIEGNVTVTFAPTQHGLDYWIEVMTVLKDYRSFQILQNVSQSLVSLSFDSAGIGQNRQCIIEICPDEYSFEYCFISEQFLTRGYKTNSLDCTDWSMKARFQLEKRERLLTVFFRPSPQYSLCFQEYGVQLFKDLKKYEEKNVTYQNVEMAVVFKDVPPGMYSADIAAYHEYCFENNCNVASHDGESVTEFISNSSIALPYREHKNDLLAIFVPSCIFLIIIVGTIAAVKKFTKQQIMSHIPSFKPVQSKVPSKPKGRLILPILYAQDTEAQNEVTVALNNFLQECCHAESILAEDDPEIFLDSTAWIHKNFTYKYPRNESKGTKYKLLILETDAAVRIHKAQLNREILAYRNYSRLNDFFIRGLRQLTSSRDFLATDHYRMVVIHFSYFSQDNKLEFFTQKRLYLPQQLVQLYNSLWDRENLLYEETSLLQEWQEKDSYKELLKAVREMEKYVINNPMYLESVFGNDELV